MNEAIREHLRKNPAKLTLLVAREFNVPEAEVIRSMPAGQACELDLARWEAVLRALEPAGNVHVIVSNGAATLEACGQFANFSLTGPFFNVQNATLDMHIRHGNLGAIFAVEKPSHMDGVSTLSIQFFDRDGHSAFKVFLSFGGKPAAPERVALFNTLRTQYPQSAATHS